MIEATITAWLDDLSVTVYPVVIPDDKKIPGVVYRIESEFIPDDGDAPYGAKGHNVRVSIWHDLYKTTSSITADVREALTIYRIGYLVSVDDRGDYQDDDTGAFGIVLDVQVIELNPQTEPPQIGLRHVVKQVLLNNTSCEDRVFASRIGFSNCNQYPCVSVSIREISIATGNADQQIKIELTINIKTQSTLTSENDLEAIVGEVELLLHPDLAIFQQSHIDIERISTHYTSVGRLHYEHRIMRFSVEYFTGFTQSGNLSLFAIAAADWEITADNSPEAQDKVDLPQD